MCTSLFFFSTPFSICKTYETGILILFKNHCVAEDDSFERYKRHIQALGPGSGRCRPCKLNPVSVLNNRLILQLGLLRQTMNLTWSFIIEFSKKLLNVHQCLDSLISGVERRAEKLSCDDSHAVNLFLEEVTDVVYPKSSPYCLKFGVTQAFLLGVQGAVTPQSTSVLPNGLVIELERFKRERRLSASDVFKWISVLCPSDIDAKLLHKKISVLMKKYSQVLKDKTRKPADYNSLLESVFDLHSRPTPRIPKAEAASTSDKHEVSTGKLLAVQFYNAATHTHTYTQWLCHAAEMCENIPHVEFLR